MNGHVFQCHGESPDKQQYVKTVKALGAYINKNLKYSKDVISICDDGEIHALEIPSDLTTEEKTSETKKMIWRIEVESYMKRKDLQESNTHAIYSVVWGQCSTGMQSKLQALPEFVKQNRGWDCSWLLKSIKGITHQFEVSDYIFWSLDDAREKLYSYRQNSNETVHEYHLAFTTLVEVLEHRRSAPWPSQ